MEHLVGAQGSGKWSARAHGRRGRQQAPAEPLDANSRRNERERNRVKLVNLGFTNLQRHVPQSGAGKRMSKVDTLRSAVDYIRRLEVLLRDQGPKAPQHSPGSSVDGGSTSGSPSSAYSSEDASRDSIYSEQDFAAYKEWLGIE
ncbi:achaete-scute homolog 1-like [Pristis pectinata]|uniref:achaete-scute homolog 1-like n=1 Tax=Pristis pectinata TaxID=685728 RepID=UPI00223D30EB|nr:achaete-scute homolog 1-like [Pristis pectinata]